MSGDVRRLRLGIDVGGTNTDAVILDDRLSVLAEAKVPTTADISSGIAAAITAVLEKGVCESSDIAVVMLGTTHATNALLQRRGLRRTAVLRISAPAGLAVPPLYGWPDDLREVVSAGSAVIAGGFEFDGRPITQFHPGAVESFCREVSDDVQSVAIVGVFSPMNPEHEIEAANIVTSLLDGVEVSLSHEVGGIGLVERENATILNAALTGAAGEALDGLQDALENHSLDARVLFAQNDGTLMSIDQALRIPVLTVGSGPSNSIRGAAQLCSEDAGIVADVGGTTTDIGVLAGGLPRESYAGRVIAGLPTNFRIPDIVTVAIGGGTIIREVDGKVTVGPDSVGANLWQEALVFGGSTPTLTDAAVHAGRMDIGDASLLAGHHDLLEAGLAESDSILVDAIDRAKTNRQDSQLIAVGGARALFPDHVAGISEIIEPPHYDVANAVGAATADIGGEAEAIVPVDEQRHDRLAQLQRQAADRAIGAGAHPDDVSVVDIEETPLAYLSPPAVRYRVRASGGLRLE